MLLQLAQQHNNEVRSWRETEDYYKKLAEHSPHLVTTMMYDDTSAVEFPHLTNRAPKGTCGRYKLPVVPWLNEEYARRTSMYVYSLKHTIQKGANRICTMLTAIIRATKTSGTPAAQARHLVLIGDNFAENKNNVILAWASDLILHGWYDTIDFLFGPVGHTHNGIDAKHRTHNQSLSRYKSCCSFVYVCVDSVCFLLF